jgi:putative transposase
LVDYIDQHRGRFGVEPICRVLRQAGVQVAPSSYYAAKTRPPSARAVADQQRVQVIRAIHADNYGVYGVRKMHAELNRRGHQIARCTVQRLMRAEGLRGISRAKGPRTTVPGTGPDTRPDLLDRDFKAPAPNRVWVADITYCRTFAGWVYAAFVVDVFSRRVVGWQLSKSLRTDLALDALEMGLWTREHAGQDTTGVIAHSDKGVQYLAVRYTQRLAEAGAVASVGSTGDSYDNALAEAFNSLFKAELVRNKGPWKSNDDLEIAVAEYIDWFNHRRLHGEIGLVPPVEYEDDHYRHNTTPTTVGTSVQSLHKTRHATTIAHAPVNQNDQTSCPVRPPSPVHAGGVHWRPNRPRSPLVRPSSRRTTPGKTAPTARVTRARYSPVRRSAGRLISTPTPKPRMIAAVIARPYGRPDRPVRIAAV